MSEGEERYKLSRVGIIMLGVTDLARSKEFYGEKLGLELQAEFPGFVFFNAGGVQLGLNDGLWKALGEQPGATNVVFPVPRVSEAYEALVANGVQFFGRPINVNGPNWAANFKDPDGHLLSVFGPE